jgi:hypothetical protein
MACKSSSALRIDRSRPRTPRDFYSHLFGWDAPAGAPVADRISAANDYSFIASDSNAPPAAGGIGGGPGFDSHAIFYVGVSNVADALATAQNSARRSSFSRNGTRAARSPWVTSATRLATW